MEYNKSINSIASLLEDKGFNKEALEFIDAIQTLPFSIQREPHRRLPFHSLKKDIIHGPGEKIPFAKKGEVVIQIDPVTGKETLLMWGMKKPMTFEEIERAINKGTIRAEYLIEQYQHAVDENTRKFFKAMIEDVEEDKNNKIIKKLGYISGDLKKRGYTLLVRKINKIACDFMLRNSFMDESYSIPSLEDIFEKSSSLADFDSNLNKISDAYENIGNIIKKFEKKFKDEIINKQDNDTDDNILDIVRKADKMINNRIKDMVNHIKK